MLLVVARVEGEGDDLRGDFGREAWELRGERRRKTHPMGLLVGWEADRANLAQVSIVLVTSAICISISAVLSLAISVIHFRMPCWEAETKDPEWFY